MVDAKKILSDNKGCKLVYDANEHSITERVVVPDLLAINYFSKEEIIDSIEDGNTKIIPNIVAVNILDSFDDLRMNLNRVLNNSDWANESCMILLNVEDDEVELLERFAIHHNVSMIMIKENDIITVNQKDILDINHTYLFKSLKNKEFSDMILDLSNSIEEANKYYQDILNAFKHLTNK